MKEEMMTQENTANGTLTIKVIGIGCEKGKLLAEQASNLAPNETLNNTLNVEYVSEKNKSFVYDGMSIDENMVGVAYSATYDGKEYSLREISELLAENFLTAKIKGIDNTTSSTYLLCDLFVTSKSASFEMEIEEEEVNSEETPTFTPTVVKKEEKNIQIHYKPRTKHGKTIEEEMQIIIDMGILSEERLNKMLKCMRENRVGEKRIFNILKNIDFVFDMEGNCVAPWEAGTLYIDANPQREPSILNECMRASLMEQHALVFVGDPSTGKNVCGETIAYCRGWNYYLFSMSAYMTKEDVYKEATTDNSASEALDKKSAFAYLKCTYLKEQATEEEKELAAGFELNKAKASSVALINNYSPLVKWVHTGGVLMLNEWNMADANIKQSFLNSILDGTKALDVPGLGLVKLHKNCMLLASENPGFTGAMAENAATKSRFGVIEFPKADECKKQLVSSLGENYLAEKYFDDCNNFYKAVKGLVGNEEREGQISDAALNIRGLKRALEDVHRDLLDSEKPSLSHSIMTEVILGCPIEDRAVLKYQLDRVVRS